MMSFDLHFDQEDWRRIERDWSAWWVGELDRPLVMIESHENPDGRELPEAPQFTGHLPLDMPAEEVIDRYQAHFECRRWHGDAFPRFWPNFGAGVVGAFFGCNVRFTDRTIWFEPSERHEIGNLRLARDEDNVWWRRVLDITREAVGRWGDRVVVAHTDLGGNLDILASLLTTEQLLMELHDAPDEVLRLVGELTSLWLGYYDDLDAIIRTGCRGTSAWAPLFSTGRHYMLQSDFAYMISPEMFERFVMPDITACCDNLDAGFYHLDGKGQLPHLDMLLSIKRLRGVQWIPGDGQPPPEDWLDVLKRIRDAGKLCQLSVSPEGILKIVRELGGKGFALATWRHMSGQEAGDFLKQVAAEDASR